MGVMVGKGALADALKKLEMSWVSAEGEWRDERARAFEERYLVQARRTVSMAIKAMDRMAEVTAKAERECGADA